MLSRGGMCSISAEYRWFHGLYVRGEGGCIQVLRRATVKYTHAERERGAARGS